MRNVVFVCDFNSIHSRNLISSLRAQSDFKITVVSSYSASEMDGVELLNINKGNFGDKSSSFEKIAAVVLRISPKFYRFLTTIILVRRTKASLKKLPAIKLTIPPTTVHALRTQPEGILAQELNKRFDAQFLLTTWGQDFILWSSLNLWLATKTKAVLNSVDILLPDNFRDDKIAKTKYRLSNINSYVLPATGGLDLEYLNNLSLIKHTDIDPEFSFLTTRGYHNAYIKLIKVLSTFEKICQDYPKAHLYVDLNIKVNTKKKDQLLRWISKRNLGTRISLLHLNREEMFSYMSQCKFHVSVTYSDGLPLSLLESLYFGQIPIVYGHESTEILEEQFDHIFTFKSYKITEIERKWKDAINNSKEDQSIISLKNRKILKQHYDRKTNVKKILDLYN